MDVVLLALPTIILIGLFIFFLAFYIDEYRHKVDKQEAFRFKLGLFIFFIVCGSLLGWWIAGANVDKTVKSTKELEIGTVKTEKGMKQIVVLPSGEILDITTKLGTIFLPTDKMIYKEYFTTRLGLDFGAPYYEITVNTDKPLLYVDPLDPKIEDKETLNIPSGRLQQFQMDGYGNRIGKNIRMPIMQKWWIPYGDSEEMETMELLEKTRKAINKVEVIF